jgi:CRISPR-associated endonuclease Cas3-HD
LTATGGDICEASAPLAVFARDAARSRNRLGYFMWYAHSLPDSGDKSRWQSLAFHLKGVEKLSGQSGAKFRAGKAAALAGLLHDLGKYTLEFQRRLEGADSVDHATAGAQEILALGAQAADRCIAEIIAHAIAGHHAGMPDSNGETSLDTRLKKQLPALDPVWREEIAPIAEGLTPEGFTWRSNGRASQLAFFGRMVFSCLVDADYRDTEAFYATVKGETVDRDWPCLRNNVDDYIARFDRYMAGNALYLFDVTKGGLEEVGLPNLGIEAWSGRKATASHLSADGRLVLVGRSDGSILVADVRRRRIAQVFDAFQAPIDQIVLSDDGRYLGAADSASTLWIFDVETGEILRSKTFPTPIALCNSCSEPGNWSWPIGAI